MSSGLQQSVVGWHRRARRFSNELINLILPPTCGNCGLVGDLLCTECKAKIVWLEEPICKLCGRPQEIAVNRCFNCRQERPLLRQIRAATLYTDPVRRVIQRMKYEGYFALAEPLAELMFRSWPQWQQTVDLVIPIPLHNERQRERGYNQSELLVRALEGRLGWESESKALSRVRRTQPQVGLSPSERRANVQGAFEADGTVVTNKRILLVDDVCTTGSTLQAAADVLINSGAVAVSAFCLSIAVGDIKLYYA